MKKKFGFVLLVIALTAMFAMSAMAAVTEVATYDDLKTAAATGGEVKVTANLNGDTFVPITKDVVIDLNGKTITRTKNVANNATPVFYVTGGKLEIKDSGTGGCVKSINTATGGEATGILLTDSAEKAVFTSGKIDALYGIRVESADLEFIGGSIEATYGIVAIGGSNVKFNGGSVNATSFAIAGNGSAQYGGTNITITGGTLSADSVAIYHPQDGILNISGGTITGPDAIQFKAGGAAITNVSGGVIKGTGDFVAVEALQDNSNGSVETGSAISLIGNSGYTGNMSLNISGAGVEIISEKGYAIRQERTVGDSSQISSIKISAGKFTGAEGALYFDDFAADKAKYAITGGKYSSDPSDYVASGDYSVAKVGDLFAVIYGKQDEQTAPKLPEGVSADVQPAKAVVTVVPDDATDDQKETAKEAAVNDAKAGSITSADLDIDLEEGFVAAKRTVIDAAASDAIKKEELKVTVKDVAALPIFSATVSEDKIAAVQFEGVPGENLLADKAGDVKVLKILSATTGEFFKFESDPAGTDDGEFALQLDGAKDYLSADAAIDTSKDYNLLLFIKDNGSFDLNEAKGEILDPAAILKTEAQAEPAHHSSSGCSAGFAALALLALVPMVITRRKK